MTDPVFDPWAEWRPGDPLPQAEPRPWWRSEDPWTHAFYIAFALVRLAAVVGLLVSLW
ncbi:MAG: hypothetical protein AAGE03_04555 [Pseudomonadota bacterium]